MPLPERDDLPRHHVYLASNFWDGLWIIQQPIAAEIAREESVVYVERVVSLWTILRYPALWRRVFAWMRGARQRGKRLWVLAPLPLFHLGHRFPRLFALELLVQRKWILRSVRRLGLKGRRILWADHPLYESLVGRMNEDLAVYHVGDEVTGFSTSHVPTMEALESAMLQKVKCVFAAAEQLALDKRALNANTHTVWNGIDPAIFSAKQTEDPLANIPSPRVAFIGVMDDWVNVELLERLAERLPTVQLLIIGPAAVLPPSFEARTNVHILGRKPRESIPAILHTCSASVIPFKRSLLTQRLVPLKLFEALAAGVTPVATDFSPDLERLASEGLVRVGRSDEEFVDQVRQAIQNDTPELRQRLREFGLRQTWGARWSEMRDVIAEESLRVTTRHRHSHSGEFVTTP